MLWGFQSTSSNTTCAPSMTGLDSGTGSNWLCGMRLIGFRTGHLKEIEGPSFRRRSEASDQVKSQSSTGLGRISYSQGSTSPTDGQYYLALTPNYASACALVAVATGNVSFAANVLAGASTGGALPPR